MQLTLREFLQNPEAGLAVYTSVPEMEERLHQSWWQRLYSWAIPPKDFVIARVPLDHVVTVKTVIADEKLGPLYKELLSAGKLQSISQTMLMIAPFPHLGLGTKIT